MSAFSTKSDFVKPLNREDFCTDREVADHLGVKSERSVRRYKSNPSTRQILGAIPYGKQWRIPKQQDWAKLARELKRLGKVPDLRPSRIFKREMGWGNPRRDRETKILRLALGLERLRQKRRRTKKLELQLEQVWKVAQIIAAKYRCTVFNAPKFLRKYLEAANETMRKHNAPKIKWLKDNGLWNEASKLMKNGRGDALFDVVEEFEHKGKKVSIPHRISLRLVQTRPQVSGKERQYEKLWPSKEIIEIAAARYKKVWWMIDIERAVKLLRRQKQPPSVENLWDVLYRDEIAKLEKRPGISRSTYFRRYSKADLLRFSYLKVGTHFRLPDKKSGGRHGKLELDETDLAKMSIRSTDGWESYNPFRDE